MVKRKQKKVLKQKQKQKQNVNVKQNVKVVIGDIKRKRAVKSSGAKPSAKPPIVLNISNPQPNNNAFMEYFKKQLQNQQPIHATTLRQNEIINEREENKASRAGALHKLDQEPDDVARELRRQRVQGIERFQQAEREQKSQEREMRRSLKPVNARKVADTPLRPRQKTQRELLMETIRNAVPETPPASSNEMRPDTLVLNYMETQQRQLEDAMEQASSEQRGDEADEEPRQIIPAPTPPPVKRGRGRPKYNEEERKEANERKKLQNEDPVGQDLLKRERREKKLAKLQQ